jgi:23S rRNA (pseudouridine1915-N3)-methyltransferase
VPRLRVVAVSNKLPQWAEAACAEYARRMPRGYELERITLRPGAREAERIRAAVPRGARIVALDERGRDLTTAGFAPLLNQETAFLIGGADGLDAGIKKEAALLLRLSSLTLAHALAQVVLLEQLYRSATLLVGHPYHRE